jgi:hydroxyethylthiazole kinase-like uncharacterized protein yjeF
VKAITSAEMRELDRRTINEAEISGSELMTRAGAGIADVAQHVATAARFATTPLVQCFAGKGNNGGDAFVAARLLAADGFDVQLYLAARIAEVEGDAADHLRRLQEEDVVIEELPHAAQWKELGKTPRAAGDILIDGLLGTGISGTPRGTIAEAIRTVNSYGQYGIVVAIDAPSGLDTDTGRAEGACVAADITATMALPKLGLLAPCAVEYVGSVHVTDIGIPPQFTDPIHSQLELITDEDVAELLPRRARSSHKGSYGHLLVLAGGPGTPGAASLTCSAAIRSGVGLVSAFVPELSARAILAVAPEVMVHQATDHHITVEALQAWTRSLDDFDAIVLGPGMGTSPETRAVVEYVLAHARGTVVMDADALNVCAEDPTLIAKAPCPIVVTPHPGEMGRLLASSGGKVQSDRFGAAMQAANLLRATIVLKGAGTIVAEQGRSLSVNLTGNPGMAKGGMGDVLAGLLGGFVAQGLGGYDAACIAVYLHGRAGDNAARSLSQQGMTPSDLINELPVVFRDLSGR